MKRGPSCPPVKRQETLGIDGDDMKPKAEILARAADRHGHELMILAANVHSKARVAEREGYEHLSDVWDEAHSLLKKAGVLLGEAEDLAADYLDEMD
jgi:hypothetical protein